MALFADLGLTLLFVRKFAEAEAQSNAGNKDERGDLLGSMLVLRIGMAIVVSIVVMQITPMFGYSLNIRHLMMIMLVTLFISSRLFVVRSVGEAFLRGHNKYHVVALLSAVDALVFAFVLYFYSGKTLDLEAAVWIYSFCHIPGFLFLFGMIYRYGMSVGFKLHINFRIIKTLMAEGFPLILGTAFFTIHNQADALLIDKLSSVKEVSAYGAGLRVLSAIIFLPAVFSAVIGPAVTHASVNQEFEQIRLTLERSLRLLMVCALFIAVSLSISSHVLVNILFGTNKYSDAAPLVILLGWAFIPLCFGSFITDIAIAEGRFWISTLYTSILMVVSLGCDFILIPGYGAFGAVTAKCIALTIGSLILFIISEKLRVLVRKQIQSLFVKLFAVALCSVGAIYVLSFFQLHFLFVFLIITGIFFLSTFSFIRILSFRDELIFFSRFFAKVKR